MTAVKRKTKSFSRQAKVCQFDLIYGFPMSGGDFDFVSAGVDDNACDGGFAWATKEPS